MHRRNYSQITRINFIIQLSLPFALSEGSFSFCFLFCCLESVCSWPDTGLDNGSRLAYDGWSFSYFFLGRAQQLLLYFRLYGQSFVKHLCMGLCIVIFWRTVPPYDPEEVVYFFLSLSNHRWGSTSSHLPSSPHDNLFWLGIPIRSQLAWNSNPIIWTIQQTSVSGNEMYWFSLFVCFFRLVLRNGQWNGSIVGNGRRWVWTNGWSRTVSQPERPDLAAFQSWLHAWR